MKRVDTCRWQPMKYLAYLLGATLLCACLFNAVLAQADDDPAAPAWTNPSALAIKRIGPAGSDQTTPSFLKNLDCNLLTYRLAASGNQHTGCFVPTAFGMLDSDTNIAIFNGTDEGLPLTPYWPPEVVVPWPRAGVLVALDAASTGGSGLSLYRNPLGALKDQRNSLLQLTGKQFVTPADLVVRGPDGKQLIVNPETLAFADSGSWSVVETLGGSFVRINLATLDMTAFAPAFGSQGSPGLLESQVALSSDGRYVAIANKAASSFKVYDLDTCGGPVVGLQPQKCIAYDYWPSVKQQVSGFQSVTHLRFVNDGLLSFEPLTSDPASGGSYELAPRSSIKSLIDYLALGDSYTSGEGAFDYRLGTDTADNMCHLSANSYPVLLTRDLFSAAGGHSVACSGAVINDVGNTSDNYRGQARNAPGLDLIMAGYAPGYVAQQRFARQYQPAIISVSIGGNDIGFGDILQKCVEPHVSLHFSDNNCYSAYEDRLELTNLADRTVSRWTALYRQLLAEAPGTRVYAVGYPQVVSSTGDCALNVHLSRSELEFTEGLIDYINSGIRQAAINAGITYVDISQALAGHRLCETASYNVAVNGLTAGSDGAVLGIRVLGKESYHPNALGQELIEQAILKQTHNLSSGVSASGNSGDQNLLTAPKSGRTINNLVPDDSLATATARPGGSVAVQASGPADSLRPNTAYAVRLDGGGGRQLASVASDASGDISVSASLPDNTMPGSHTIDVTGQDEDDKPVDVTQPIYVVASDSDADGDGIPDTLDTCPGAVNSGQDSDHDGVDDTCDGFIGTSSPGSGSSQPGQSNRTDMTDTKSSGSGGSVSPGTRGAGKVTLASNRVFRPSDRLGYSIDRRLFKELHIIYWWPWVVLWLLACLLVLLGTARYFIRQNDTQTSDFRLQ